ncbi:hypothetical protein B0J11DRAFT_580030 [Dendryphion nanum]|uniref:Aldehyde dehydrogenase domain-containing protein n=1 Tax=Dendryphion nanum TaxID=256645 RepID=A0A9P9DVV4_9PLEO|nr:hypothetical protein B0J11DRAFT_580030 [Dendryphion nanum]
MPDSQSAVLARVKGAAIDGRLRILRIRQQQFLSLHSVLVQQREAALQAIQSDDNCSLEEALIVYGSSLIELRNHYNALDLPTDLEQEYRIAKKKSNEDRRTPIAITYIIPGKFTLFFSVLSPLCAALEAGSCVIVELQNTILKTPKLLQQIIFESLDREAFGIVSARAPVKYLAHCVVVDQNTDLTLGGISPRRVLSSPAHRSIAVVDRTGDVELAAKEIVASRSAFGGATPYAVDLVIVNEFVLERFNTAAARALNEVREREKAKGARDMESEPNRRIKLSNSKIISEAEKDDNVKWVGGDSNLGLLQVLNRDHPLARSRLTSSRVVFVHPTTSLDDSIDLLSTDHQQEIPIAALYLFSADREAKYLSQYIANQATYVNHIPAQLLIGPRTPFDYPINLQQRYTHDMFEIPSPQIVPSARSHLTSTILKKASFIDSIARKPLKDMGQPPSGAWGFFEQGIVIGAFTYLLPMIGITITGFGYVLWKCYWNIRG